MSANLIEATQTGTYTSGNADIIALIYCDSSADLPAPTYFSGFYLYQGSTAEIIDTGRKYRIDSVGVWMPVPATTNISTSVSLDLTGYYTSAQVDSAIATALTGYYTIAQTDAAISSAVANYAPLNFSAFSVIQDPDPSGTPPTYANLNDFETIGVYYRNTNPANVQNLPAGLSTAFKLVVEHTSAANRLKQTIYPTTQTPAAAIYWRIKTGGGWQAWYKLEGVLA